LNRLIDTCLEKTKQNKTEYLVNYTHEYTVCGFTYFAIREKLSVVRKEDEVSMVVLEHSICLLLDTSLR